MTEPARVDPAETPRITDGLALQVGVVAVAGLYFAREVLIPVTLAILLSFLLTPAVHLLRKLLPRVLAVLLAVVLALGLILALGGLIGTQVASLAPNVPRYVTTLQQKFSAVQSFATSHLASVVKTVSGSPNPADAGSEPLPESPAPGRKTGAPVPVEVHQPDPTPLQLAERVLDPLASPLSTVAIVFIFSVFILLQQDDLRDRMIRLVGSGDLHRTTIAMDDAGRRLSKYFLAQAGVNLVFGCVIAGGLWAIGVPSPVLWGVLSGLLRFVPYVGPILAAALPMALAAAVSDGWALVGWTAALFAVAEGITGQVVEPLLYGHSTGLSPFAVVVAATFWTWLWGPIGLILSTPLTLCLVVLGRHVKRLEFLDIMLGDRPALTPMESFYQRMLAGDPDEAQEQAEVLLKDRSLSSYYDDVALKGLQLAANDLERGVLNTAQMYRVRDSIKQLAADLESHEDVEAGPAPDAAEDDTTPRSAAALPEAWRTETAVMCLAGRGPLDEAASILLAQLLRKHGLGAQVVDYEAASRGRIDQLPADGVAMVCISYLEISGNPSHLRYLLTRLRSRLPRAKILVGIWPAEDKVFSDESVGHAIGSDFYTSSLHDAVEACLAEAHAQPNAAPGRKAA